MVAAKGRSYFGSEGTAYQAKEATRHHIKNRKDAQGNWEHGRTSCVKKSSLPRDLSVCYLFNDHC